VPTHPFRVLIAPDSFKSTLTAAAAAAAMAAGVRQACPDAVPEELPVADGGEGTVAAVVAAGGQEQAVEVPDALGRPVLARFAVLGDTAVIESAKACGLHQVTVGPEAALASSSAGVGRLIRAALDLGYRRLVVGLGGTAGTDGGAGMASELGVRFTGRNGAALPPGGGWLAELAAIDASGLDPRLPGCEVRIACDVTSPLLGPSGAAAVFGPQKGAGPAEVDRLAAGLARYADLVRQVRGIEIGALPGGGAAGGLGAGLVAFAGGRLDSGIDYLLRVLGVADRLAGCALVLTGEGSLDAQSLAGKAPVGVARLAAEHGVPVLAVAGRVELDSAAVTAAGFAGAYPASADGRLPADPASALAMATARAVRDWLSRVEAPCGR